MQLLAVQPPVAARSSAAAPQDPPFYGSRWERSFSMTPETADRLQKIVAGLVPMETEFPNPERIQTVYVRSANPKSGIDEKFRIRTYPDSPGPPTVLEFKDRVKDENGNTVTKKVRIPLASDAATRLMWGESGESVIGREGRTGEDLAVAERAITAVDKLHLHPVARQEYTRTSFEDAKTGVRITFDRNIHFTGIGELVRGGSFSRPDAIMDIKVIGKTPEWLATMLTTETAAKQITEPKDGKGGTAVEKLFKRVKDLDASKGAASLWAAA
jgi:hypothetical protein